MQIPCSLHRILRDTHNTRRLEIAALGDILVLVGRELADVAAAITGELAHERRIGGTHKPGKER